MTPAAWIPTALAAVLALGALLLWSLARDAGRRRQPADARAAELLAAGLLPLVDCPRDRDACLRCLLVDRCVVHRLLELGLTPGTAVRVVQDGGGPMLLSVRGSRVALGRDLAARVWVELPAQCGATDDGRQTTEPAAPAQLPIPTLPISPRHDHP